MVKEALLRSSPDIAIAELSGSLVLRRFNAELRPEVGMAMRPF